MVPVHLFSSRNVVRKTHEAVASCVTDVLTAFWRLLGSLLNRRSTTWSLSALYNKETKTMLMTSSVRLSSKNEPIKMREKLTYYITNT